MNFGRFRVPKKMKYEIWGGKVKKIIGIRREDKNEWERRVPIIPAHIRKLEDVDIRVCIQPQKNRAFADKEYLSAGAKVTEDIEPCPVILGVKEIPTSLLRPDKIYLYFSHTIKGQPYNMPMLQRLVDLKCTLIDYECIKDENGKRLVFFGRYAGLAGMIDALHILGKRLKQQGLNSPFEKIKPAYKYHDLEEAKSDIALVGKKISENGLPADIAPMVVGFAGYGHVSKGAQEIYDLLPVQQITPRELVSKKIKSDQLLKVVFKEEDMVVPVDSSQSFSLQDYYEHPEKYESRFEKYLPFMTILLNGIYWENRYPRLVTKSFLKKYFAGEKQKLQIISDISCDINGSIECTEKTTIPDEPAFVYNPLTDTISDGIEGRGIIVLAVDNIPAELPRDSSAAFSEALWPFIPGIVNADLDQDFQNCNLPAEIKRAAILYKGQLTPAYRYLNEHLDRAKETKI